MIDTHCHLADKSFDGDRDEVIKRAKTAGVESIVAVADKLDEAELCISLAHNYPSMYATAGVHPHNAHTWQQEDGERLRSLLSEKGVVALGEIGLDYHYTHTEKNRQKEVFQEQLIIAQELHLPSVIHTRESIEDVWEIVNDISPPPIVLHCCTETYGSIERFIERGDLISFTGIATFENAHQIRDTIDTCPLEKMMIETDAPYLAPVPYRGQRNEPAFVRDIAVFIAEIKGLSLNEIDAVTSSTAKSFFGLSP